MAEPNGWSWVGTRLAGSSQIIVYDRGTDYGEFRYNPFTQSMERESGEDYIIGSSDDSWRFLIATDFLIDFGTSSTIEKFTSSTETTTNGYLDSVVIPFGTSSSSTSYEDIGDGYTSTTDLLSTFTSSDLCVLTYVNYWRNNHMSAWFLPTVDEMTQVYSCKESMVTLTKEISHLSVANTSGDFYLWTSSGSSSQSDYAYAVNWKDGSTNWMSKNGEAKFILCRYL